MSNSSKSKKYYWMKLFDTFFQDARIKKLKRLAGGDTYIVITLKLMLQTIKTSGIYEFEGLEKSLAEELELKIDEDYKDIQLVLDYLNAHNMIIQVGTNDYEITQVKTMIGSETATAARMRNSRARKKINCNNVTPQLQQVTESYTELELELELDITTTIYKNKDFISVKEEFGISNDDYEDEIQAFVDFNRSDKNKLTITNWKRWCLNYQERELIQLRKRKAKKNDKI